MKVHRDLQVSGLVSGPGEIWGEKWRRALAALRQTLGTGWSADKPRLEPIIDSDDIEIFFYTRATDGQEQDYEIRLPRDQTGGKVAPTISTRDTQNDLSVEDYNSVLTAFWEAYLWPACDATGAACVLSPEELRLEEIIPTGVVRDLAGYLQAANWGSSGTHPLDQRRWMRFIINALDYSDGLDGDGLVQFLTQDYGVPERWARRLGGEFDFGQDLLTMYRELLKAPASEPN